MILKSALKNNNSFLQGEGEMSEIVRAYPWAETQIGTPDTWPQSLRTALGIVLRSAFPMFIFWGDDFICFYNDAYRPSLGENGKHPAVGKNGKEVWPEIWHFIGPIIDQVRSTAKAVWYEDQLLPIFRNGTMKDVYWTFSYSPIYGDSNCVEGVFVTCTETTEKVKNINRLVESEHRFHNLIKQASIGMIVLMGEEMRIQVVNQAYCNLIGRTVEELTGNLLFDIIPETEEHFRGMLNQVRLSGEEVVLYDCPYFVLISNARKEGFLNVVLQPYKEDNGQITGIIGMCQDVTEQVLATQKTAESERQFRLMADSIVQMVWITNSAGMYEYCNQRWYEFTGFTVEQSQVQGWKQIIHPDDRDRAWKQWNHSLTTGTDYEIEYRLANREGEYVWILGQAAAVYDQEGRIIKWFGTCTDIHEQKQIQQQKEEFISIASHELKTPLTSLKATLQFLEKQIKKEFSPGSLNSKMVDSANTQVKKLSTLVNDLLDVTKIEQGQLILNKTEFTFSDIVNSCCDAIAGSFSKIRTTGDINAQVLADYPKIEQVLINLINNSFKYAPNSNEIVIHAKQETDFIKISVQDFGPGISPEKLPHLFAIYYRADTKGNQYSGLGLGLYICYKIITNHGGHMGVESDLGHGSTFTFTLPNNQPVIKNMLSVELPACNPLAV
jgi:PAS domain S-box-containing protein